ncbi:MAG: hypothetical protein JWO55_197, partial [Candidatus Saccharibacteria bacterium]|nr:hypothetical protein [Candidatus Saccharibacteria bacterium]
MEFPWTVVPVRYLYHIRVLLLSISAFHDTLLDAL